MGAGPARASAGGVEVNHETPPRGVANYGARSDLGRAPFFPKEVDPMLSWILWLMRGEQGSLAESGVAWGDLPWR